MEKKKRSCIDLGLAKLNYRMRTEKELRDALFKEGYSGDDIEKAISFFKEEKYLDDKRYVEEYFRAQKAKFWSLNRIILSLAEKGVDKSFAKDVISDYLITEDAKDIMSESEMAIEIANRMLSDQLNCGKEIDDKFRAKVFRRLTSLGYAPSNCFKAINMLK